MNAIELSPRIYYEIKTPIERKGCPSITVPPCQASIQPSLTGKRKELLYQLVTMRLIHATKTGKIKNSLSLRTIHLELETHSLMLQQSGSSNILLSKVSFDCLVEGKIRDYLSFDLRIPEATTESVFSYDLIESMYNSKKNLYETLKHFYELGRSCANPKNHKHGHTPSYNPSFPSHDQYIRHTEQLLTAYLHLPQGAKMLCNRLRTEIRAKYSNVSYAKIYNMTLHMHSTKTCCAPCEYSLIGMTNTREHQDKNGMKLGFIPNFTQACSIPNERLTFRFPKKSSFQVLVTVTASSADADHRKSPNYIKKTLGSQEKMPDYVISTKEQKKNIFTSMLDTGYSRERFPDAPNLIDKTVGISGSNSSPGSAKTKDQVKNLKKSELDDLVNNLFLS